MSPLSKAQLLGLEAEYLDAFGKVRRADERVLSAAIDALGEPSQAPPSGAPRLPAWQGAVERGWILAVQLYSLRSNRSWGIGDFGDLKSLLRIAAEAGASGIGLNPLHVLFHEEAADCSPYWPSSRQFLNPLYIDLNDLPELVSLQKEAPRDGVEQLNGTDLVDYAAVARLKRRVLRQAFEQFQIRDDPTRQRAFAEFREEQGIKLARFCAFETLRRTFQHSGIRSLEFT